MTNERAIEVLNKHTACREAACNLNCDECKYNVQCEEVTEALEIAKLAIYRIEAKAELMKNL